MSKSFHPLVDSHVLAILLKCCAKLGTLAANIREKALERAFIHGMVVRQNICRAGEASVVRTPDNIGREFVGIFQRRIVIDDARGWPKCGIHIVFACDTHTQYIAAWLVRNTHTSLEPALAEKGLTF